MPSIPSLAQKLSTVKLPKIFSNHSPLWQGPSIDDPNGGVTQSALAKFIICRERFRIHYVLGLQPHGSGWNHKSGYGDMWHICEEALASNQDWMAPLEAFTGNQMTQFSMDRETILKWYNVCRIQFPEYVKYWNDHPEVLARTPLMQEQVFNVPYKLPSGRIVYLKGKYDAVDMLDAHDNYPKGIWLQEDKSKGDIDQPALEKQLKFDLQTNFYLISLQCYAGQGYNWGDILDCTGDAPRAELKGAPLLGVRYNVIRRPLSGGAGTIRPHKAKAFKNKTVPAETMEHFYERLRDDYIAANPEQWFFRWKAAVTSQDIQAFKDQCLDPLLEQLCWWYDQITGKDMTKVAKQYDFPSTNHRTPYGIYSKLMDGGESEQDIYLNSGSMVGLKQADSLFKELK